jgi:hypothetical protein
MTEPSTRLLEFNLDELRKTLTDWFDIDIGCRYQRRDGVSLLACSNADASTSTTAVRSIRSTSTTATRRSGQGEDFYDLA